MNEFILLVTIVWAGLSPSTIHAEFSSQVDCESARVLALKEAALISAHLRSHNQGTPTITAICKISN